MSPTESPLAAKSMVVSPTGRSTTLICSAAKAGAAASNAAMVNLVERVVMPIPFFGFCASRAPAPPALHGRPADFLVIIPRCENFALAGYAGDRFAEPRRIADDRRG